MPLTTNIREAYKNGKEDEQNFIQNLALFLCTFLKEHGVLIEQKPELQNNLLEVRGFPVVLKKKRGQLKAEFLCLFILGYCLVGIAFSGGNIRSRGEGDFQDLLGILEPPDG